MKFKQNPVTVRFVEVFNSLKEADALKNASEFARTLDFSPQSLNEILKGRRDVTIELLRKLFIEYNVNPRFVFNEKQKGEKGKNKLIAEEEDFDLSSDDMNTFSFYMGTLKPLLNRIQSLNDFAKKISQNKVDSLTSGDFNKRCAAFRIFEKDFLKNFAAGNKEKVANSFAALNDYYDFFIEEYFRMTDMLTNPFFEFSLLSGKKNLSALLESKQDSKKIVPKSKAKQ